MPTVKSMSCATFLSTLPARGATKETDQRQYNQLFLSTLPARGATRPLPPPRAWRRISIHAPREGSDLCPVG